MDSGRLHADLTTMLNAMRSIERDTFTRLDPAVRDAPGPDGGWSPKDVQAHLTGWKARQLDRLAAARRGEEIEVFDATATDSLNASMQAARAGWSWDAVSAEADTVSHELAAQLAATPEAILLATDRLLDGTFANGPEHTLEHIAAIARAHGGEELVTAYAKELGRIVAQGILPDTLVGAVTYNLACFHALSGRLDTAQQLLSEAFQLRPELREWAAHDTDLAALRGQPHSP